MTGRREMARDCGVIVEFDVSEALHERPQLASRLTDVQIRTMGAAVSVKDNIRNEG